MIMCQLQTSKQHHDARQLFIISNKRTSETSEKHKVIHKAGLAQSVLLNINKKR